MDENLNLQFYQPQEFLFARNSQGLVYHSDQNWEINPFDHKNYQFRGNVLYYSFDDNVVRALYTTGEVVVMGTLQKRTAHFRFASSSKAAIEKHLEAVRKDIPKADEADDGRVKVKFWFMTNQGPNFVQREIEVPDWEQIESNYETDTRGDLTKLLYEFKPSHGGQLILWQGDPGTGKTYALRSLTEAWKKWCSVEYIVDPDAFFGGSVSYLMNLINSGEDVYDEDEDLIDEEDATKKEWKLFIFEDTGELLTVDARERAGQGLARLLNVVDGFIGQGLKILVLITSNEELQKLHPAVSRPGRCAAIVKFDSLPYAHAQEWASERGITLTQKRDYSLAELFALKNDFANKPEENLATAFGFRKPE